MLSKNRHNDAHFPQRIRPRRNRKNEAMRGMVRENVVTPLDFIYPLFIFDDQETGKEEISSMPGTYRHSLESMMSEIDENVALGIKSFILFPKVPDDLKTNYAESATILMASFLELCG